MFHVVMEVWCFMCVTPNMILLGRGRKDLRGGSRISEKGGVVN